MYHKLSIEETLSALDVNPETGLSDKEAAGRLSRDMRPADGSSFFKFAKAGISRPLIWVLLISAVLTAFFSHPISSVLLVATLILNIIFSAEFKRRGYQAIDRAVSSSVTYATVLRNGAKMKLSANELVVGDIVTLKKGKLVPADLRLISGEGLVIDETVLGGRGSVLKEADEVIALDIEPLARVNCAFEGTVVVSGRGDGVVISTGMSTELSRLTMPLDAPEKDSSPVLSRLTKVSKKLSVFVGLACVLVFIISNIYGGSFLDNLIGSLALAVAVIPESLYTAALMSLSKGASHLKKEGFAIKNMKAAESLGEVSVYITDIPKLGVSATYSSGRIKLPHEEDTVPLIDGLLLCKLENRALSSFASHKCNPEEVKEAFPKIGELSGEVSTSLHRAGATTISYTGGDALEILRRSERIWEFGHIRTLTESDREEISDCIESFVANGLVPTAIGMRSGDDVPCDTSLVFIGIAASAAEEKEVATPDISALRELGVGVYLLTSLDAAQARLGAVSLGIPSEKVLSGREISKMRDLELMSVISGTFVYAGLSAADKVRVASALQGLGHTVCAMGDAFVDAPLVECADVGISEMRASDPVKSASGVIINGENSASRAITIGKTARRNLSRVATYLYAANLAELVCVFVSVLLGFGFPMSPLGILLINLVTDTFPVLFITNSKKMRKKRSRRALIIVGIIGGILAAAIFKVLPMFVTVPGIGEYATFAFLMLFEITLAGV